MTEPRPDAGPRPGPGLAELVATRHVLVCCGTGGVGKTTTAAALAIAGARAGRRTVVLTIDPAKRLADTLGAGALGNLPQALPRVRWDPDGRAPDTGQLDALMLDAAATFEAVVRDQATSPEQAERILGNRFARSVAGALSGTQEYMAAEKLYELHTSGDYDLIVVDTPPTRHALDFLDAPDHLARLLRNRVFRLLMTPGRVSWRLAGTAVHALLRRITRVVGGAVIDDLMTFLRAFEGMEAGFAARGHDARALLADPSSAFVVVTTPRRDALEETATFAAGIRARHLTLDAVVVNRVHAPFADAGPVDQLRAQAAQAAERAPDLSAALTTLADLAADGRAEHARVRATAAVLAVPQVVMVSAQPRDAVDVATLDAIVVELLDRAGAV